MPPQSDPRPRLAHNRPGHHPPRMSLPVLDVAGLRAWETQSWNAGRLASDVINQVGRQLARRLLELTRPHDPILLVAGRGRNGDDVRAAREHLDGRPVTLIEVGDPAEALPRITAALRENPAWIVDGLFGIGLNRPLAPDWLALIDQLNSSGAPLLAVDVPSGLNPDTGIPWGGAIRARLTLSVGAPKIGFLRPPAWEYTGRVEVLADVGLLPTPPDSPLEWVSASDFTGYPPPVSVAQHKGDAGHLLILAGSKGYHGAAVLAARAAQHAHPGLISLGTAPEVWSPVASQLQAVMVDEWSNTLVKGHRATALLVGPGLADRLLPPELREVTRELWQNAPQPMVVDASALDWLPPGPLTTAGLRVITPHPGEAARLLQVPVPEVQAIREDALRRLSARFGEAWVVLKGHQTLTGQSSGPIAVNSSGGPSLAQGGTGDLLAGFLAGLLARPDLASQPATTLRYAVWRHGDAADRLAAGGSWVPEDLAGALGGPVF